MSCSLLASFTVAIMQTIMINGMLRTCTSCTQQLHELHSAVAGARRCVRACLCSSGQTALLPACACTPNESMHDVAHVQVGSRLSSVWRPALQGGHWRHRVMPNAGSRSVQASHRVRRSTERAQLHADAILQLWKVGCASPRSMDSWTQLVASYLIAR